MKKDKLLFTVIFSVICLSCFPIISYANSSWHWVSDRRPYDVLPFVIIITLLIETFFVVHFAKVKNLLKAFLVVLISNILSFIFPYFTYAFDEIYTFEQMMEHTPSYTIGLAYLLSTLIIEFPLVYGFLFKDAPNEKSLISSIIVSNIITTILVFVIERILSPGCW
ncbi:MAG: hypothetical protein MR593_04285 [Intestinibacter sp.]|uniref:hypothetical protein n=1 Tax=Intestinibacter sp. TaxID=1965304 RepID=UPI0025B91E72|nr:hypothetical protein [Intestinibacter sp.]MCI6737322.1 hypothetical protein [Intestinibacter sp.]